MPRSLTFALVVILCGALDIAMHMAAGDLMPQPTEFSSVVNRFGFGPVVVFWVALAFGGMGLVFLVVAPRMSGRGMAKGLRYGFALGLLVQMAMFEGVGLLGTRVVEELVMGLADAVPIFLMAVLLGHFLAPDSPPVASDRGRSVLRTILVFSLVYGAGRLGAQMLGLFDSGLDVRPVPTVAWTFAMGATIGVMYLVLSEILRGLSRGAGALAFGLGVYGANWALFMVFVPLVSPDAVADSALRVGADIVLITGAALLVGTDWRQAAG